MVIRAILLPTRGKGEAFSAPSCRGFINVYRVSSGKGVCLSRMKQESLTRVFSIICCILLLVTLPHETKADSKPTDGSVSPTDLPPKERYKAISGDYFIENEGQLDNNDILFYTTSSNMQIGFAESTVSIKIIERGPATTVKPQTDFKLTRSVPPEPEPSRGVLIRIGFEGANKAAPQGRHLLPHPTNFFIGNDPNRWRTGVRSYEEIAYEDLYEGIDLVYRIGQKGVKYDFIVQPGADPARIHIMFSGMVWRVGLGWKY
jgi:hypothetical protein